MRKIKISFLYFVFISQCLSIHASGIEGETTVEIAQQGESHSYYHMESAGYSFYLIDAPKGVYILEEGTLIVEKDAKEGIITIVAKKGEDELYKQVQLVSSWTTRNGKSKQYSIPSIEEARFVSTIDTNRSIPLLRWTLIVLILIFLSGYGYMRYQGGKQ